MDGDITDRGDFDRAVSERFPKARRSRKETKDGWEDTFDVGPLSVRIRVHDRDDARLAWHDEAGKLTIDIRGVRTAIDGSSTSGLWQTKGVGWDEGCKALDGLREELLGIAHGLYRVCKKPKANKRSELEDLSDLWRTSPDLTTFIENICD
jgi:hypothetical protein